MSTSKEIGGRVFAFGQMPALEAVKVEVSIARVIGEPLFKAFMDAKDKGSSELETNQAAATAVGLILSKMNGDELVQTMETVFKYVSCDGKRVSIDAHFTGRNKDLWLVFIEALKVNFSDFFTGDLFASVRAKIGG